MVVGQIDEYPIAENGDIYITKYPVYFSKKDNPFVETNIKK
jgi:hypothetical protein